MLSILRNFRSHKFNYKVTVFVICLAISALIWLLIRLSGTYTLEIVFPVRVSGPPPGKILISDVDTAIRVGVEEKGYVIAWLRYFANKRSLNIDLSNIKLHRSGRYFEAGVNTLAWSQDIEDNLSFEGKILYIDPDTLFFLFENESSKMVTVIPDVSAGFKPPYNLYDSIHVIPSQVELSGLPFRIDTIRTLKTEHLVLKDLTDSVSLSAKIKLPDGTGMKTDPEFVNVIIPVDRFTESELTVPVTKMKNSGNLRIRLYPDQVKVTFLVSLRDFKNINAGMFSCSVDLQKSLEEGSKKTPVILESMPRFVKILRIQPAEVEYLILK